MDLSSNTILITGGASGIGLALAGRFLKAGSEVIIVGRRAEALAAAKAAHPGLHTHVADVSDPSGRVALAAWAVDNFPRLNVLINNAGIMRYLPLTQVEDWAETRAEIATNVDAPIHLSMLLQEHLRRQGKAAIMNVTSGLAFVPLAVTPVYSATKAAMHSFTLSLRHQLAGSTIEVVAICPPLVATDLGKAGANTAGMAVDDFADVVIEGVAKGLPEITAGFSTMTSTASREQLDAVFVQLNAGQH